MPDVPRPLIRRRYPHLRVEESRLLRGYLQQRGPDNVERLRTQHRVGQGEIVSDLQPQYAKMARDLSRWKIDAVIDWPGETELVELKSRATHTAVGQLEGYNGGMVEQDGERNEPRKTVVAFRAHPDIRLAADRVGVEVHLMPHLDQTTASR